MDDINEKETTNAANCNFSSLNIVEQMRFVYVVKHDLYIKGPVIVALNEELLVPKGSLKYRVSVIQHRLSLLVFAEGKVNISNFSSAIGATNCVIKMPPTHGKIWRLEAECDSDLDLQRQSKSGPRACWIVSNSGPQLSLI